MIYIPQQSKVIKLPDDAVKNIDVSNFLYENLDKGHVLFLIPEDIEDAPKNIKKTYKVGFLFDVLTVIYPSKGKEDKHKIISEKFHLWFTYRQFHNVLDYYFNNRAKFLAKRSLLKTE